MKHIKEERVESKSAQAKLKKLSEAVIEAAERYSMSHGSHSQHHSG